MAQGHWVVGCLDQRYPPMPDFTRPCLGWEIPGKHGNLLLGGISCFFVGLGNLPVSWNKKYRKMFEAREKKTTWNCIFDGCPLSRITYSSREEKNQLVFHSPHLLLDNGSTNLIVEKNIDKVISIQEISEGNFFSDPTWNGETGESKLPEISPSLSELTQGPKVSTSVQQFMAVPVAPAAKPDNTSCSDECKHCSDDSLA